MTRHFLIAALSLSVFVTTVPSPAEAATLVRMEAYDRSICSFYYDDGSVNLSWCLTNWPSSLTVSCNCEHYGSPFDDICDVYVAETNWNLYYTYSRVGYARITSSDPYAGQLRFSCPYGTPPGASTCTARVTVTAASGATGSALCYSF